MKQVKKSEKILKALANAKRLKIINLLDKYKELDIGTISKLIDLHYKTTAKHLDNLASAGLIKKARTGLWMRNIFDPSIKKLLRFIESLDRRKNKK